MDWKSFIVEIVQVLIWPALLFVFLFLFKKQVRELLGSISKLTVGNSSAEFGKKMLAKEINPQNTKKDNPNGCTSKVSKEDVFNIPDDDYEFMMKIAANKNFMPTDKREVFKYNSLVNHGYFTKEDNDKYMPTLKGSEIIGALKSIYHSEA